MSIFMALWAKSESYAILSSGTVLRLTKSILIASTLSTPSPHKCPQSLPHSPARAQYFFLKYLLPPASCKGSASSAAVSPRPLRFPERPLSASLICA